MSADNFQSESEKLRGVLAKPDEQPIGTTMFQNVAAKLRSSIIGSSETPATTVGEDWHDLETPPAVHIPNYEDDTAKLRQAHVGATSDYLSEAAKLRDTEPLADSADKSATKLGEGLDMSKRGNLFGETGTLIDYRSAAPFEARPQTQYVESHVLEKAPAIKAALPDNDMAVKTPVSISGTKHTHAHFSEVEASGSQPSSMSVAPVTSHEACAVCVQRHNSEHHARHSVDLQDAAATAALYVQRTKTPVARSLKETYITSDNKLSSAGS